MYCENFTSFVAFWHREHLKANEMNASPDVDLGNVMFPIGLLSAVVLLHREAIGLLECQEPHTTCRNRS